MTHPAARTVTLPLAGGGHLAGTLELPGGGRDVVLYVHGFGSDRKGNKAAALHSACRERAWGFAAFDFRGHGESPGRMADLRASGLLSDLEAVRLFLAGEGLERLFLVGSSMGGFAAAWYAVRRPEAVPALALLAPAFDFLGKRWARLDEEARQRWRREGVITLENQWVKAELGYGLIEERGDFDAGVLAERWGAPALIFHGMRDESVDWQDTLRLVERTPCPHVELRLWRDGDHRLLRYAGEMAREACRFFARQGFRP